MPGPELAGGRIERPNADRAGVGGVRAEAGVELAIEGLEGSKDMSLRFGRLRGGVGVGSDEVERGGGGRKGGQQE
jgi:hypothetical protein